MRVERDILIAAATIAAVLLVSLVTLWLPYQRDRSRLETEIAATNAALAKSVSIEAEIFEQRTFVQNLKAELSEQRRFVPRGANLGDLLRRISTEVTVQSIKDHETQTLPIIRGEDYSAIPVVLRFNGSFPSAYGLVKSIETMPRLVRVTALNIDGDPTKPGEPLHVRVELAAFFTGEEEAQ